MSTTVLIIEDDRMLATSLHQNLAQGGYQIAGVASNLTDALDLMRKQTVDLALIDIELDGPEDGVIVANELSRIRPIPFIFITGRPLRATAERSNGVYPAAFLSKPLRSEELMVQIDLAMRNFQAGNIPASARTWQSTVLLPAFKGHILVRTAEILFVEADGIYAKLFVSEAEFGRVYPGKAYGYISISNSMGYVFSLLTPNFYRLSRSLIISLDRIERITSLQVVVAGKPFGIPEGRRKALIEVLEKCRK
ncbi:two component transcriptional regulator, LytTR family [Dyadobacter sp. SG02]|uniref:response regulator transcription factor n=1 Tax=Dyadobacter sp. SG02 TaxID=1855291 RepID=UPI0008B9C961|nr:response regulator [Dyadobacter sp. SG02]SEI40286.1 two component transcriptional regulator, LytTR family [Dyadobacter sp. SG02]